MKTIQVIFTKSIEADLDNTKHLKRYTFNTEAEVEVEDLMATVRYPGKYLMVVSILAGEHYTHYNKDGELAREKVDDTYEELLMLDYTEPEVLEAMSRRINFTLIER